MPARNVRKIYAPNSFYHIYNRGVDERIIFGNDDDYKIFLYYLKRYLTPPDEQLLKVQPQGRLDLFKRIKLICYCLMPNHFHLLIKQITERAITELMRRLGNAYVRYFNEKYDRRGSLFETNYKAALIDTDSYLLHSTRYIHRNPGELELVLRRSNPRAGWTSFRDYPYSSYADFLGKRNTTWVHPKEILEFFKKPTITVPSEILTYKSFVEDFEINSGEILGKLILE